jgi:MFS family permease
MVRTGMAKLSSGVREPAGYRWIVVGVSTAVSGLAWGARSTFALFYVAMLRELAWGRGPTALGYSLSWLAFVAFAPMAGWLHDRWGARTVVSIGGLALGLALALTGQVAAWFAARPAASTRDVVTSLAKGTGA